MRHCPDKNYENEKKIKHWLMVLVFLVIVLTLIRVRISDVSVMGSLEYYTADEAEKLVFSSRWDRNTIVCIIRNLRGVKKDIPFISDYEINITGPFSCELIIYEKKPVGCIEYMGSFMYFDKDGIMIESYPEKLEKLPVIEGVSFGYIVLGQRLPVKSNEIFTDIMNINQQLDEKDIDCEAICFDSIGNITLKLDGGDINVYIGKNDYLEVKINALYDMLPKLREKGLKGTLELNTYTDSAKDAATSFRLRE